MGIIEQAVVWFRRGEMKLLRTAILIVILMVVVCSADCAVQHKNLVAIAARNKHLTTWVKLVKLAGLEKKLRDTGPYTVFVPTNAAFAGLPEPTRKALVLPKNRAKLRAMLLYHVVRSRITSRDIMRTNCTNMVRTLKGPNITIQHNMRKIKINDSKVVRADVEASNGIIHVVDQVLIPPAKKP